MFKKGFYRFSDKFPYKDTCYSHYQRVMGLRYYLRDLQTTAGRKNEGEGKCMCCLNMSHSFVSVYGIWFTQVSHLCKCLYQLKLADPTVYRARNLSSSGSVTGPS